MFEDLANYPWENCRSKYDKVREEVNAATTELTKRDLIMQILWENGGRCDCTVGHNIVDQADIYGAVSEEIAKVLSEPAPPGVVPLLERQGFKPSMEAKGRAKRLGEDFVYERQG